MHLSRSLALILLVGSAALTAAQDNFNCGVDRTPPGDGDRSLLQREYARAAQIYTTALQQNPENPSALAGLIRAELGEGRLDDALTLARKAVAEHPKDAVLEDALGDVAFRRGEPEQAIAAFEAAMRMNPCLARIHFDFSRYLELAGLAGTARKQLEIAHSLAPNDLAIDRAWQAANAPPLTPEQSMVPPEGANGRGRRHAGREGRGR